jgi:large subunit ribosomal protein L13
VKFTGRKWEQKTYQTYSHYPGGHKTKTAGEIRDKHPERIIESAVRRMVPRNRLGRQQMAKLKVYAGAEHPHQAQQPQELKLEL